MEMQISFTKVKVKKDVRIKEITLKPTQKI